MIVMIAVHPDGDILEQKRLSPKSIEQLEKMGLSLDKTPFIDSLFWDETGFQISDFPEEVQQIFERNGDYGIVFYLDDAFHDVKKDFDVDAYLKKVYGECPKKEKA